jgi:HAD superfamily hydrolase (TIGR01549 family)
MPITTVLFDLDGTLLPMDQKLFVKAYFGELAKKFVPLGYSSDELIKTIWHATDAMVANAGDKTNEQVFWEKFSEAYGRDMTELSPYFDGFYENEFQNVRTSCGFDPDAKAVIDRIKSAGYRVAIATNPIFPPEATESRVRWAGLDVKDFEFCTTFDNSHYAKPNPLYYSEILERMGISGDECLMVGNDLSEDTAAEKVGIGVFILTNNLIERKGFELSNYAHGGFAELLEYLNA